MAIEFSCPHCHHVLRTRDDKAGLSAKCPACSETIWVPLAGASPAGGGSHPGHESRTESPHGSANPATASPEIPRRRAPAEVKCPNCSAANDAAAETCRYCGTSLEGAEPIVESPPSDRTPEVGEVLSTAWRIYSSRFGLLLGASFTLMPLAFFAFMLAALPVAGIAFALQKLLGLDEETGQLIGTLCWLPLFVLVLATLVVGVMKLHLNIASGAPVSLGDLLYGFGREGRGLVPGMMLLLAIGMLSAIVIVGPMFVWPLLWMHVDQRMSIREGLVIYLARMSSLLGFTLLTGLILGAINGMLSILIYPCCIGILLYPFVQPFCNILAAVGYLRWAGLRTVFD